MATTAASMADLPTVRRFEAAGFRAWPAERAFYDGTWSVRLTPDMKTRRLNSVNPLDRADLARIDERIVALRQMFEGAGRPLVFRISPLAGPALIDHLKDWQVFSPSLVMRADLGNMPALSASDALQLSASEFIGAATSIGGLDAEEAPGLARLLDRLQPERALFQISVDGRPAAVALCVRDGQMAGLFEVATAPELRERGLGRRIVGAALDWARGSGAKTGWLQVDEGNVPALALYRSLGFETAYPYHYRMEVEDVS